MAIPIATAILLYAFVRLGLIAKGVPLLADFSKMNANMGVLTLIINLVPFRNGTFATDGHQLYRLLRNR